MGVKVQKLNEMAVDVKKSTKKSSEIEAPKRKNSRKNSAVTHLMTPYERKVGHFLQLCPVCKKVLKLRYGKNGHKFVGCSGYPECRYTRSL